MRLNRESLGNLLQHEASCAIYSFSVDVQPKKRSEWTFNQRNATSGRNGRSRPVAVILRHDVSFGVRSGACGSVRHDSEPSIRFGLRYLGVRHVHRLLSLYCHDRISNNDGKTTFSPTIAESRTSQDAQKPQRAFFRPHCVPNPKIAEIYLLRHCRDRDVMFGRRDMEHKVTEVYTIDR